jgi:hypothetical protein
MLRSVAYWVPLVGGWLRARAERRARELARLKRLRKEIGTLASEVRDLRRQLADKRPERESRELREAIARLQKDVRNELRAEFRRVREILQFVYDDEPGTRQRVWEMRAAPEYELAFTEPKPLVSVIIPTYSNVEALVNVAVPSLLEQTYRNFEITVVGDGEPPGTDEALAQFGDPRIVYFNRERRGPYPEDPELFKFVKAGPPFNEGLRHSRGRWITVLADDDAFRPDGLEALVTAAQEHRYEFCYGQFTRGFTEQGEEAQFGTWPPGRRTALLAAIYHAGLRFLEFEFADAALGRSWDKTLLRRMMHSGVRFGMIEKVIVDFDPVHNGIGGYVRSRESMTSYRMKQTRPDSG